MPPIALETGSVLLLDVLKHDTALLFEAPEETVTCTELAEVPTALARLEAAQRTGKHAAGFLAYELGFAFEDKLKRRFKANGEPLLWFGVYDTPTVMTAAAAKQILAATAENGHQTGKPVFDMSKGTYRSAFEQARDHLAKGDIYQVNLTMRAGFTYKGAPESLFLDLLRRQPVQYAAYIRMADRTVLSLSPELFVERRGALVRTKPMKGTAPRGRFASEDLRLSRTLAIDPKQRAENTMIVDLMRNDLSRIAETGSVKVSELCAVERYPSLHQMTSTVEAQVPKHVGFAGMIEQLFPCGSITGAPKLSAMQIAHDLETGPRGVYTGAIGHLEPGGDFRLNVAIRTLVLKNEGIAVAGTGSGVVSDSSAEEEYAECALKLRFLSEQVPEFDLLETLAFTPTDSYLLLERHLQRMQQSADYFGFKFDAMKVRAHLKDTARGFDRAKRVRVLLNASGEPSSTATDLACPAGDTVFNLELARETTQSSDRFLFHKTTNRAFYDDTRERYQAETGCQEVIFTNENGFLTEGSYTTLFLRKDGRLLTPALAHGLLPGTFRAGLLERGLATEADLTPEDLLIADEVLVGNSVRGLVKAQMLQTRLESAEAIAGKKAQSTDLTKSRGLAITA